MKGLVVMAVDAALFCVLSVRSGLARARRVAVAALVACTLVLGVASQAMAQTAPTLPDVGVDFGDLVDAVGTALGAMLMPMMLLAGAILIVRTGMRWLRRSAS